MTQRVTDIESVTMNRISLRFAPDLEHIYRESRFAGDIRAVQIIASSALVIALAVTVPAWLTVGHKLYSPAAYAIYWGTIVTLAVSIRLSFLQKSYASMDRRLTIVTSIFAGVLLYHVYTSTQEFYLATLSFYFFLQLALLAIPAPFLIRARAMGLSMTAFIVGFSQSPSAYDAHSAGVVILILASGALTIFSTRVKEKGQRRAFLAESASERQRERVESLLHSIMPPAVAATLGERTDLRESVVQSYDSATVLFADLVGFTKLASSVSPEKLVRILNSFFSRLDQAAIHCGVEKVKTIGDCYMAVSGVPTPTGDHVQRMAEFAFEVREAVRKFSQLNGIDLRVRIGMHCGPVVAGVIGTSRFHYDLWGETVNTAARLEAHGVEGEIQVSEAVRDALIASHQFEDRGEVELKSLGSARLYILRRPKSDYLSPNHGIAPMRNSAMNRDDPAPHRRPTVPHANSALSLKFLGELESQYREDRAPGDLRTFRAILLACLALALTVIAFNGVSISGEAIGPSILWTRLAIAATLAAAVLSAFRQLSVRTRDLHLYVGTTVISVANGLLAFHHQASERSIVVAGFFVILSGFQVLPLVYTIRSRASLLLFATFSAGLMAAANGADEYQWITVILTVAATIMCLVNARAQDIVHRVTYLATEETVRLRTRADSLLRSIVPPHIADRLRDRSDLREAIVQRCDAVTVLFADLVGFTKLATTMPAEDLVAMLNALFSRIDAAAAQCGVEKIKTIGDAYMAVSGTPIASIDHVERMADFALELREVIEKFSLLNRVALRVRIGMHSGPVVAGVIGTTRFHYDLWGETVNIAARLESHGVEGAIQISETVRQALGDRYECSDRGIITMKGMHPAPLYLLVRPKVTRVSVQPIPDSGVAA